VLRAFAAARDVTKQLQAQRQVVEQEAKERERLDELEQSKRLAVGRELKKEIGYLKKERPARNSNLGDQFEA
jgi:hypothetical protein